MPAIALILLETFGPMLVPLFASLIGSADAAVVSWFHATTSAEMVARNLPLVADLGTFAEWLAKSDQVTVDAIEHAITNEQVKRTGGLLNS